jgi:hypothetical protein
VVLVVPFDHGREFVVDIDAAKGSGSAGVGAVAVLAGIAVVVIVHGLGEGLKDRLGRSATNRGIRAHRVIFEGAAFHHRIAHPTRAGLVLLDIIAGRISLFSRVK